jgi:hypothetical protein
MFEFRRGRPLLIKPTRVKRFDIPKPNFKPRNSDMNENDRQTPIFIQNLNKNFNNRVKSPKRMRDFRNISIISEGDINDSQSSEFEREDQHESIETKSKINNGDTLFANGSTKVFGDLYPITSTNSGPENENDYLTEETKWIKNFTTQLNNKLID